jgi:hypothetical protein
MARGYRLQLARHIFGGNELVLIVFALSVLLALLLNSRQYRYKRNASESATRGDLRRRVDDLYALVARARKQDG